MALRANIYEHLFTFQHTQSVGIIIGTTFLSLKMPTNKLSDAQCKGAKPRAKAYNGSEFAGRFDDILRQETSPTGTPIPKTQKNQKCNMDWTHIFACFLLVVLVLF